MKKALLAYFLLIALTFCACKNIASVPVGGEESITPKVTALPEITVTETTTSAVTKAETTTETETVTAAETTISAVTETTTAAETTAETTTLADILQYNPEVVDNEWALFLVNQANPIDDEFSVTLKKCIGNYKLDERCVPYMKALFADAKKAGINLNMVSAHRTVERQKVLFQNDIDKYVEQGLTQDEAYAKTKMAVAVPYESEHHTGLAADILSDECWQLNDSFEKTKAYEWLKENAHKYGFILRYTKDKMPITGIIYEPWHYRFVGLYHADAVYNSGLCLEEYMENLQIAD